MLRRSKDEHWREKPEKKEIRHELKMPHAQAMAYAAAVDRYKTVAGRKGAMLEALHALRIISLHPFPQDEPHNHEEFIKKSARLEATFNILDEIHKNGEKALIFVEYLSVQSIISEIIERRYGCRKVMIINGKITGKKRQERVDDFQIADEGFEAMILSPKAGGVGLNLTAASHVLHLSRWWNPAVEDQCSDRAYRIGQNNMVTIHYPMAIHPEYGREQSFDVKLHDLLERKRHLSRSLLAPPAGTSDDINWLFEQSIRGQKTEDQSKEEHSSESQENFNEIDLDRIDLMEPLEFEGWVLNRFKAKGYNVKSTPVSGDAGSDGIAIAPISSNNESYIIQCKHTQSANNIDHHAVEEILASLERYRNLPSDIKPMVVTNAKGYTLKAIILSKNRGVKLVSRANLTSI